MTVEAPNDHTDKTIPTKSINIKINKETPWYLAGAMIGTFIGNPHQGILMVNEVLRLLEEKIKNGS